MKKLLKYLYPGTILSGIQTASVLIADPDNKIVAPWYILFLCMAAAYTLMFLAIETLFGDRSKWRR